MAKFCYKCGSPLIENAKFCARCGAVVMQSEPAAEHQPEPQPVYQQPAQPVYQQPVQPPVQQPVQPPVYQNTLYQQPVYPVTQQLAQNAYMEQIRRQNAAAAVNMKPQRYIPLRILLILVCLGCVFCALFWGINNIQKEMAEPSAFSVPAEKDEDIDALQAEYDAINAQAKAGGTADDGFGNTDFIADWIYRERS